MALTVASLARGSSTSNTTSYTTASFTPTAARTLFVVAKLSAISSSTTMNTVSGLSGTWTLFNNLYVSGLASGTQFTVHTCSNYSGTGSLSIGNTDSATHAMWGVYEIANGDTSNPIVASSWKTVVNSSTTGLSITMDSPADTNNRPFSAWFNDNNTSGQADPATGWTELDDIAVGSPNGTLETQWFNTAFDTGAGVSFLAGTYSGAGVAFELAVPSTGGGTVNSSAFMTFF